MLNNIKRLKIEFLGFVMVCMGVSQYLGIGYHQMLKMKGFSGEHIKINSPTLHRFKQTDHTVKRNKTKLENSGIWVYVLEQPNWKYIGPIPRKPIVCFGSTNAHITMTHTKGRKKILLVFPVCASSYLCAHRVLHLALIFSQAKYLIGFKLNFLLSIQKSGITLKPQSTTMSASLPHLL